MGRFDRNSSRRFGGGGGGFDKKPTTMFPAVCDKCGKECKVPFKPSGDKPIYCSNCFEKQGGGSSERFGRRDSGRDGGSRRSYGESNDREMFSAVCDDCGNECKVPFNPSSDKPIYCSKCFEKRGNSHDNGSKGGCNCDQQSEKLNIIIEKLDKIVSALETKTTPEKKKVIKKMIEKKEVAKKKVEKKEVVKKTKR